MSASPLVEVRGIRKTFRTKENRLVVVFDGFSMEFHEGAVTAILGPTGCGKSTLLSVLNGLEPLDAGTIRVGTRRVGTVLQKDLLLPWRTVVRNLELPGELAGLEVPTHRLVEAVSAYRLSEYCGAYPDELSGGTRQKVSLLRTLLYDPHLVLLDEPFGNIDYFQKLELEGHLLAWLRASRRTAILVTHDVEEAIALANRVVVFSGKPVRIVLDEQIGDEPGNLRDPVQGRRRAEFGALFQRVWGALSDGT